MVDLAGCEMCYGDVPVEYTHKCLECGTTTCDGCYCRCDVEPMMVPATQKEVVLAEFNRRIDFLEKREKESAEFGEWRAAADYKLRAYEVERLMITFKKLLK